MSTKADLTDSQMRAVEAATKLGEPSWHDGIVADILGVLDDKSPPPWSDKVVQDAIKTAVENLGIDTPFM